MAVEVVSDKVTVEYISWEPLELNKFVGII
jgi:hypothetical protein